MPFLTTPAPTGEGGPGQGRKLLASASAAMPRHSKGDQIRIPFASWCRESVLSRQLIADSRHCTRTRLARGKSRDSFCLAV